MIFRTTFLIALLGTLTSVLSAPINSNALSERSEESSLLVRDIGYEGVLEERGHPLEERNTDDLYELVTRSPVPEPLPNPEMEDVERRFGLGMIFKIGAKIGKKIASAVHKSKKASNAVQNNNNNSNNRHHKRSKIGDKIKNFFKKVGNGLKKAVTFAAKLILRRDPASKQKLY